MKVLVFIDHDITVRHFLHSRVFERLGAAHEMVIVLPETGNKRVSATPYGQDLSGGRLRRLPVSLSRLKTWQGLMLADHLRWRRGAHHAAMRRFHRHAAGPKAAIKYGVLAQPGVFHAYRHWTQVRMARRGNEDLDQLLAEERPDVIIHPTVLAGVFINDLVLASRKRDIPLILIMNSWDNPSTKRAMTGRPDWLLVWGPQTQNHAVRFMGMPRERTLCFGAAQFDLYRDPPRISRAEFCRRHGIDPTATVLLYAGSSKGADEYSHLRLIDEAIEDGRLAGVEVVYRPHPWGGGGKGGERIADHPWRHVRVESTMCGYLVAVKAGNTGITTPDYRDTHDVLEAVDMVVSPLSTIIIEGALHGKPVMCFLPADENTDRHLEFMLPLTHFEDLFAEPSFLLARGNEELVPRLRELHERTGDAAYSAQLRRACEHFVTSFGRPYGERIVEFVESAVRQRLPTSSQP